MTMFDHDGGRGVKISEKSDHVVYGWPLKHNDKYDQVVALEILPKSFKPKQIFTLKPNAKF